jgi:hypothetical protein
VGKLWLEGCVWQNSEVRSQKAERPGGADVGRLTSDNLSAEQPPAWMTDLANGLRLFKSELPTGVIVGSAVISHCTPYIEPDTEVRSQESEVSGDGPSLLTSDLCPLNSGLYEWHLADVQRVKRYRKPRGHPQPVWFTPFD